MDRKIIQDRLRKKEQEIQSLEEKIKASRVYIQALQDVLRMTAGDSVADTSESALKTGSAVDKARETILRRGKPVHINELLEAVGKDVTRESRASLVSSIAAYVRRGEIFTRPAPNTFGLIELGHIAGEPSPRPPHPPEGFGKVVPAVASFRTGAGFSDIDDGANFSSPDDEEIKF